MSTATIKSWGPIILGIVSVLLIPAMGFWMRDTIRDELRDYTPRREFTSYVTTHEEKVGEIRAGIDNRINRLEKSDGVNNETLKRMSVDVGIIATQITAMNQEMGRLSKQLERRTP